MQYIDFIKTIPWRVANIFIIRSYFFRLFIPMERLKSQAWRGAGVPDLLQDQVLYHADGGDHLLPVVGDVRGKLGQPVQGHGIVIRFGLMADAVDANMALAGKKGDRFG